MRATVVVVLATGAISVAKVASALQACSAADIIRQETFCPSSGACAIANQYNIGDGCILDFSERDVRIGATGGLTIGSGSVTLRTNKLTLAATAGSAASITGRGTGGSAPANQGGTIIINASGDVNIEKAGFTRAAIEVSATQQAGTIIINAGGTVTIAGRLEADQEHNAALASGGTIFVGAGGDIISPTGSQILAGGGRESAHGGGTVDLQAGGKIALGDIVTVSGSNGGAVKLTAGGDVVVSGINGSGTSPDGEGAHVEINAGHDVQMLTNPVYLNGSDDQAVGGNGGTFNLQAPNGNLNVAAGVFAEGRGLEGDGGMLTFFVRGSMVLSAAVKISVRGYGGTQGDGPGGYGGTLDLEMGQSVTVVGTIDASGAQAGSITLLAKAAIAISGPVQAVSFASEDQGGSIAIFAGDQGFGALLISSVIDATGNGCDPSHNCAFGGEIDLSGCDVTLTGTARVMARGPANGGTISIVSREQLRIDGFVNALALGSHTYNSDGFTSLSFPANKPPIVHANAIQPPADSESLARCVTALQADCLVPCPTCGNHIVEFPEQCDDGNTANCDACSAFCAIETCSSGVACSGSCDLSFGCGPSSCTPTPTAVPTQSATPTMTPPPSPTATQETRISSTPTPVQEAATPTPTLLASPTPTVVCTGDCSVDGEVTVDELVTMVSIALGSADVTTCAAGDGDHDMQITINEIIQAVTSLLDGCQ